MARGTMKRYLSMCLVVVMLLTTLLPVGVYAADDSAIEDTATNYEEPVASELEDVSIELEDQKTEQADDTSADTEISDYATFLSCFKVLEGYAQTYAEENAGENANALIINYIRTGVERYTSGTWEMVCGKENTAFTAYVSEQDTANNTSASALKNLGNFTLPNGNKVDLGHVFGAMDVANYAKVQGMTDAVVQARADMGSWAGDITDLMYCAENVDIADKVDTTETDVDTLAANIRARYLGVDYGTLNSVDHSFTDTDLYGDMDAFYLTTEMNRGGVALSTIIENYFTAWLTDASRASYFLTNRLDGMVTKDGIRSKVMSTYTGNTLIGALESSYSLTDLSNYETLRKACCYAFADYLFDLAGDPNGTDPVDPDPDPEPDPEPDDAYYSVFSSDTTTVAPGVTQTINYALTKDDKQIVYYIATADISRDDVSIHANYHANDPSQGWAMSRVSDQMTAAQKRHSDPADTANYVEHYNAVVGVNADFYNMTTGAPSGALVMEGVEYHSGASANFFAILKDGTAMIGSSSDYAAYKDQIQEAVGGSVYLVKDGKSVVTSAADYYNSRHSRTCVGITAEGKVVLMVLDGRQEPFSAGGSAEELAQIMLDAGCVTAINLDGGGSTTFVAKQEGSNTLTVVNRPSDGYERSVSSSLMVVSTAPVSTEFDHALITSAYDYLTSGAAVRLIASGVSVSGSAAELPADITWKSADETIGTVSEDGVFTAVKKGSVEIQLLSGDTVIGSKTLTVVEPNGLKFSKTSINAIYGDSVRLPLVATYNENPVAVCAGDITFELSNSAAGTVEAANNGFAFTGSEASGLRNVTITAMITRDYSISATIKVAMYSANQAIFDFDNATSGDRTFAWTRDVSNAEYLPGGDGETDRYHVIDPSQPMNVTYVFGLDMMTIKVPEKLEPLLSMVAGGDISGITAWDLLLQLAERVSSKTEVTVKFQFDQNVAVDISNLTVSNDYFRLTSASLDENNLLTVKCNFIKQSQAIDPDTANPVCILSGVKLSAKDGAQWDADQCLSIENSGSVGYDIYLGANALYSMAKQTSFQEQYGIYPYEEPENTTHPCGGHFYCESYQEFTDRFILDNGSWSGWKTVNGASYYFVENNALKGIHKVPGLNDESNEYFYQFNETTGACEGKVTGLIEVDGAWYYAINGVAKSGWWNLTDADGNNSYYYFDPETFQGLNGENSSFFPNVTYQFENGKLVKGAWLATDHGKRYYYGPGFVQGKWYTIEGNLYFFNQDGYRYEGLRYVKLRDNHDDPIYWYDFGEDGICHGVYQHTGLFYLNGNTYYTINGMVCNGLYLAEDGYYYYFGSVDYTAVKNTRHWVSYPNDTGFAPAFYSFDEDGRMIIDTPDPSKDGIVNEDGELYYYVNGVRFYAGLIQIDGNYYYVNSSCKVVTNQRYWVSKTNDLLPAGFYNFDVDGKMTDAPITTPDPDPDPNPDPEVKNGIVSEDGELYYYVNGVKTYAGLIQIDGNYYYVNSYCKVITNQRYWVSKTNDLLTAGFYNFGADGKMTDAPIPTPDPDPDPNPDPEVKNGIVSEDGELYYYVNGVKTYAGLIQIDGNYYYVNSYCKVITNQRYWVSKTNDLLPAAFYNFDAEGKMTNAPIPTPAPEPNPDPDPEVKNGIVSEDGELYYYVDGVKTYAGLIQIDGDYYYVNSYCKVITSQRYWVSKTNNLLPATFYTFGADGKMVR
jgi:glucan-binding YG repeat protein